MSLLKQMFSQNSHWQINKDLARKYGLEVAILISDLVDKWIFFGMKEWFFNTAENIQEDTTLSRRQQDRAIKVLISEGFIEYKLLGTPAKKGFKINEQILINSVQTSLTETSKLKCTKRANLNVQNGQCNNKNKEDKNKEDNNKDILSSTEDFSTTTPIEVKETPKEKVSPKRKGKDVVVVSERDRLITSVHSSFIEYWCKDYKTDYVFAPKDARAIKNIATKLHDIQLKQGNVSEDKLMVAFRLICSFIANYNDYYKSADLSTVDSKLNTIIDLIKTKQHGINQATQSEGRFSQFINKG